MFPYLIVFTVSIIVCCLYNDRRKWIIIIPCLLLSLLAGFRDKGIGTDTLVYIDRYFSYASQCKNISDIINADAFYDKGFLLLALIASLIDNEIGIFYFIIELVILTFCFLAYYRLSKYYKISLGVFMIVFLFLEYNYSLNAMRQLCAMSIVLFAFSYLIEKKWLIFSLWELVSYFFHSSAIISLSLVVFVYISNIEKSNKRIILTFIIIGVAFLAVAFYSILLNYFAVLDVFKSDYAERYQVNYYEGRGRVAFAPLGVSLIIYLIMYLFFKHCKENSKLVYCHFLVQTIYTFTLFLSLYNVYAYRIGLYFFMISILLFSVELSSKRINNIEKICSFIVIVFYWFFNYVINNNSETIPYTSKILGI
ncbi:MAG: EpsG family protein [Bacteroidales bacterium]|nr:EpsG family protein [Bacteroidales bacterium]